MCCCLWVNVYICRVTHTYPRKCKQDPQILYRPYSLAVLLMSGPPYISAQKTLRLLLEAWSWWEKTPKVRNLMLCFSFSNFGFLFPWSSNMHSSLIVHQSSVLWDTFNCRVPYFDLFYLKSWVFWFLCKAVPRNFLFGLLLVPFCALLTGAWISLSISVVL